MLPASAALKTPATLLLPSLWYGPGKMIDVHRDEKTHLVRLGRLIRRGMNYDLCAFEAAEPSPT